MPISPHKSPNLGKKRRSSGFTQRRSMREKEYDPEEEERRKKNEFISLEDLKDRLKGRKEKKKSFMVEPLFPGYFDSLSQLPPKKKFESPRKEVVKVQAGRIFDPNKVVEEEEGKGWSIGKTPTTPSKRLQQLFTPRKSIKQEDKFVEDIVSIERRIKSQKSSRKRKKRKSVVSENDDPKDDSRSSFVSSQQGDLSGMILDGTPKTPQKNHFPMTPKSPGGGSIPTLFKSIDPQHPLKLQYDPHQLKGFGKGNSLKDYKIMAEACNRGGKNRMEGLAHYKLATMYEEMCKPGKAIRHYRKFLYICQGLKDEIGTSLCLNRLGVVFQTLGGKENFKTALEYHIRHWEIADTQSKIVAHINMGLIFQHGSQDLENAAEHYRMAFQYALEIGDKHGESIALSNLGTLGKDQGDFATAEVCMERHLQLSETMKDGNSTTDAYQQLGFLSVANGKEEEALEHLDHARQVAHINNDQVKANQIKCSIGIIKGSSRAEEYLKEIGDNLRKRFSYNQEYRN